jgi:hypothetical protein
MSFGYSSAADLKLLLWLFSEEALFDISFA